VSYNSSAEVYVVNDTGGTATITLAHRYSTDPPEQATWTEVPPGQVAGPLTVHFNCGTLYYGQDTWWIGFELLDGQHAGTYASAGSAADPGKQCTMSSEDDGKRLHFAVDTTTFVMEELSGSCSTSVSSVS